MNAPWRVYETDNGPGGISWELQDASGVWKASLGALEEAVTLVPKDRSLLVYTLEAWYAAHDANGDAPELVEASYVVRATREAIRELEALPEPVDQVTER